jgi:hypothetical protein
VFLVEVRRFPRKNTVKHPEFLLVELLEYSLSPTRRRMRSSAMKWRRKSTGKFFAVEDNRSLTRQKAMISSLPSSLPLSFRDGSLFRSTARLTTEFHSREKQIIWKETQKLASTRNRFSLAVANLSALCSRFRYSAMLFRRSQKSATGNEARAMRRQCFLEKRPPRGVLFAK